jgi:MFS family permease
VVEAKRAASIGRVLTRRNFWPYFAGNLLSNSGTWFQSIAQVLLIYRLTRSPFLVGVVNFSQFAPVLFLAPWAGAAADRFDRRRLVITAQACAAVLAAALAAISGAGRASPAVVVVVALGLGIATALSTPALQALVPSLIVRPELPAAVALNAVTFNLARALGPVAAVFVIARYGIPAALAINSVSYLALVAGMLLIRPRSGAPPPEGRMRVRDSIRYVRQDRALLAPIAVVGLVSLTADPVNTLSPSFATEILGREDTFSGFLVGAFGTGAVVAAFTLAGRAPSYRAMALSLGVMGVGMATFALAGTELVTLLALGIGGFGYLASVTAATSLLHLQTEESHRGRVMSLWSLSFHGSRPLGSLLDGAIASVAGIRIAGVVMALPAVAGSLGLGLLLRRRSAQAPGAAVDPLTTSSGSRSSVSGSQDGS